MSVRCFRAPILGAALALLLASPGAWAVGSKVHVGSTCHALQSACIAKASKAAPDSPLTLAACDAALAAALATPAKTTTDSGAPLFLWPQMGASLPEKCSN